MRCEPREVSKAANGVSIFVEFIHTDDCSVIGVVTASGIVGLIKTIRQEQDNWVLLEDSLDRVALFEGTIPHPLQIDLEKVYVEYVIEGIVR